MQLNTGTSVVVAQNKAKLHIAVETQAVLQRQFVPRVNKPMDRHYHMIMQRWNTMKHNIGTNVTVERKITKAYIRAMRNAGKKRFVRFAIKNMAS